MFKLSLKENIKAIRKKYGLTQQQLADIAGVTNKAVSAWESGISEPRMGAIEKIANKLNLKKSDIIDGVGFNDDVRTVGTVPLIGTICAMKNLDFMRFFVFQFS